MKDKTNIMSFEDKPIEKTWKHIGLDCKVNFYERDNTLFGGWRCGYVGLPKGHICYELSYDDIPVDVHGGLTYSSLGKSGLYWVGFDTIHAGDRHSNEDPKTGHFWELDEVVIETNRLAEQLSKLTYDDLLTNKIQYMPEWFKNYLKQHLIEDKRHLVLNQ